LPFFEDIGLGRGSTHGSSSPSVAYFLLLLLRHAVLMDRRVLLPSATSLSVKLALQCRDRTIWWLVFLKRSWRVGVSLSSLDSKDLFPLCFALVSLSLLKRYLCIRISSLNR
jgi:hypothetical protein